MADKQGPEGKGSPGLDPAELLAHSGWVRALAARLVLDPHHADDVVQDVWHTALRSPPRPRVSLGAWLKGVVRNVTAMGRRTEARRRHREVQAARPAATASTADLAERAELQARLTARVNHLPEVFRDVVLLRFFEGLPPRKIAERLGIPLNTVRSRLTRALAKLREGLDDDYGDRRSWGLALLSLVRPSDAAAAGATPALVSGSGSGVKPLLAAGVVVVVGVGAWLAFDDGGIGDPDRQRVVFQQAPSPKPALERQTVARVEPARTPPAPIACFHGRVLDPVGRPLRDQPVVMFRLAPDLLAGATTDYSPRRTAPVEPVVGRANTDREGRFVIEGSWPESLFVVSWGRRLRYVTATPKPGQPVDVGDLVLPRTTGITGRVVDARGHGLAGARVRAIDVAPGFLEDYPLWQLLDATRVVYARGPDTAAEVADSWHRLLALAETPEDRTVLQRPAWLDEVSDLWPFVEVETQSDGRFELHGLRTSRNKTTLVVTKGGHVTVIDEVTVDPRSVLDVGVVELAPAAIAQGQVFDSHGMPLPDAEVFVAPTAPNDSPVHFALPGVHTDSEGSFKVPGITTDRAYLAVRAGPGDPWIVREHGVRGFMTVLLPPRHQVAFRLVSRRHETLGRPEITLVPGHRPLAHVRRGLMDALVLGERLWQRSDGRWQIEEVLPGRYTLVVQTPGQETHALSLTVDRSQEHVLYLDPVRSLTVQVQNGKFEPVRGAQVFAQSLKPGGPLAGITLACGETDAEGEVTMDGLVGQSVTVTATHPVHGIAHRTAELMDGARWQLRLRLPGRIAGRLTDTPVPGEWTVQMRPMDTHRALPAAMAFATPDETGGFGHALLPQGRYGVRAIRTLGGSHPKEDLVKRLLHDGSQVPDVVVDSTAAAFVYLATKAEAGTDPAAAEPVGAGPADPAQPTLEGTVQLSDGSVAEGVRLELRQVAGERQYTAHTDKQGRFRVQDVRDGNYVIVGRGPGPSRCRLDVVVRDGKPPPLNLQMTDGVFVNGRLDKPGKLRTIRFVRLDAKGNWLDAEDNVVELRDISKLTPPSVRLDASGRFQEPIVLRAGRYEVTPAGRVFHGVSIEVGDADREDIVIPELGIRRSWPWLIHPVPLVPKPPSKDREAQKDRRRRGRR